MTKKRLIKLLMGRVKLSRDSARLLCGLKADKFTNEKLYNLFESCIPEVYGANYTVAHIRLMSCGFKLS